jgi:hypothetical protein
MTDINRIRELAGMPVRESESQQIKWDVQERGKYITGTWQGFSGPIEFLADGYETDDGYWKIFIRSAGLNKEDVASIVKALSLWFNYARTADFGDDIDPVNDVQLEMPVVDRDSLSKISSTVTGLTGLKVQAMDSSRNKITIDFRNTPIPYADEYMKQQIGNSY